MSGIRDKIRKHNWQPPRRAKQEVPLVVPLLPDEEVLPKTREVPMVGLWDFEIGLEGYLSFRKGDIIMVTLDAAEAAMTATAAAEANHEEWLSAMDWKTQQRGLIPWNYVSEHAGESLAYDVYHDIRREAAERLLMLPIINDGTYLLRPSNEKERLALSVAVTFSLKRSVNHHKIAYNPEDRTYCLRPSERFPTLDDLLKAYSDPHQKLLATALRHPCPRISNEETRFDGCVVSRESVSMQRILGQGNFGQVWLARYRGVEVAAKIALASTARKDIVKEAAVMHALYHPRLVRFIGVCCAPPTQPLILLTEYMPKGSLETFLRKPHNRVAYDVLIRMLYQVSEGMAYLEESRAVHNDLRSANVLVDLDNGVKLADFGLAKFLRYDGGVCPYRWASPESLAKGHKFCIKADVWSFGVLMFEVLTYGGFPYQEIQDDEVLMAQIAGGLRLCNPTVYNCVCPDVVYAKMLECWNLEPSKRPSFPELRTFLESLTPKTSYNAEYEMPSPSRG